jgi:hypothetical protein
MQNSHGVHNQGITQVQQQQLIVAMKSDRISHCHHDEPFFSLLRLPGKITMSIHDGVGTVQQ